MMKNIFLIIYHYEKFHLKIKLPEEIQLFMKAAHIDEEEVLNKDFWQMEVEDNVFLSHDKHPNNKGYAPDMPKEPLSRSRRITVLIHGFYLSSKKLFELEPEKFEKRKPLVTCSSNLPSGWRIYFSFYD